MTVPVSHGTRNALLKFAESLADLAGEALREAQAAAPSRSRKADGSWVTSVDLAIERVLVRRIQERFPEHGIVSEECGAIDATSDFTWFLDPIDGTQELIRGLPHFATCIACYQAERPVVGVITHPALDLSLSAARGEGLNLLAPQNGIWSRSSEGRAPEDLVVSLPARACFEAAGHEGSAYLKLTHACSNFRVFRCCYGHSLTALGSLDAAVEINVRFWDIAASRLLIEEAGGEVRLRRRSGEGLADGRFDVVMGRPAAVRLLAEALDL